MRPAKNRGGLEEPPSRGRVRTRGAGPRTGVQTREQLEDAACTKVEAPPDTRRHEVLVLGKQGLQSRLYTYRSPEQTPTRTELGGYPLRFYYHRVGAPCPITAHSFSSWVPTQVSLAQK